MPSSSKQSSGTIPSVQEWKPLDFQTASPVNRAASNSEPQAGGGAGNFVELVEIVKERISLAQNPVGEATGLATEEIQLWQPETLVAIANVTGNTHDHLRSREIIQQAEARLRQARIEAEQILAQAKGEAERILMEAREQANLIHRQLMQMVRQRPMPRRRGC